MHGSNGFSLPTITAYTSTKGMLKATQSQEPMYDSSLHAHGIMTG